MILKAIKFSYLKRANTATAYQDLISYAGVIVNKANKFVDIVLTQIPGIQVDQLLKSIFAKNMAIITTGWHSTRLPQISWGILQI